MLWLSDPEGDPPGFEIGVVLLRPRSRGAVRLRSPDPCEPPSIELPNLNDPSDVDRLPHVVGTCSMGPRPDDGAVVDAAGRVHGTDRLSVIDASIMPDVPSGFTHIPTIMIAERLSELDRLKSAPLRGT